MAVGGLVLGAAVAFLQVSDWALPVLPGVVLLVASLVALVYGVVISTGGLAMAAGSWEGRVRFSRDGSSAYVPGAVAVKADLAQARNARQALMDAGFAVGDPARIIEGWHRLEGDFDSPAAVEILSAQGFTAQVVHVFFSHSMEAAPFYGSPFYGSPFYGSPFYGSPFYGSPFYGSPFYGSPFYGSATPSPFAAPVLRDTGRRRSSARPETPRGRLDPAGPGLRGAGVQVAILDTGWIPDAHLNLPGMAVPNNGLQAAPPAQAVPPQIDEYDADEDNFLDPIAGHATFIAGIIEMVSPGCQLTIVPVLTEYGDGDEGIIAAALENLSLRNPPHLVNLSFGGYPYAPPGQGGVGRMDLIKEAIELLQAAGTVVVASAGNDANWVPTYPAAFDGVIGVGAVDSRGFPASFTNYGDWVSACAIGVEVVSIFFTNLPWEPIREAQFYDQHPRRFEGWASWSGTSFAAPRVVAALAAEIAQNGFSGQQAVNDLIAVAGLDRLPLLGTLVNP